MEKQNAKFAFFYLLSLFSLIFTALSTGMAIFQIINKKVVDPLASFQVYSPGMFDQGQLRFAISAIIIAAPIYFAMMWLINKNILAGSLNKDAGVRRWLTYFILLISAVVMIGWLIGTINIFLNGDLSLKFVLKVLTSIIIAAAVFTFYLYDMKRKDVGKNNVIVKSYYFGSMAVVLAALISSFFFIDSPQMVRSQRYDENIIVKFDQIQNAINAYFKENDRLPADLIQLTKGGAYNYITEDAIVDPGTNQAFEYKVGQDKTYELCATFKTENKSMLKDKSVYVDARWLHDAGYQCLKQRVAELDNTKLEPVSVPVR